jgi:glycosyltransferase involved in cell wall biosynthesis
MRVGLLVNQYPKVSHTFVRREAAGLEAAGLVLSRFSIRRVGESLVDPEDVAEAARTRVLLDEPPAALASALAAAGPGLAGAAGPLLALTRRGDRGLPQHLAYLAEAAILRRWCAEEGVDHVHVHFGTNSATVAYLCRRLGGPPFSMTVHGPEEFDRAPVIGLARKVEAAAFTVAISDYGRSQLYRLVPRHHWERIHVVRCGLDADYLEAEPSAPPGERRLVFVGRLSEQKGAEVLIEATARLHESGRGFSLVLVGDGERRSALEEEIRRRGIADHVEITGWADGARVRQELARARALVLPSFAEGLPVVLMEALALGRPAISTYVAGIPELVRPGESGWLVPAGSVEPLVGAMAEALDASPEALRELGAAGRRAVLARHDARENARSLAQLIAQAHGARASASRRAVAPGRPEYAR